MSEYKAFTLKASGGLLRVLQTHCGVCAAFDPLKGGVHPQIEQFNAIWDTGATGTVISQPVVDKLNLQPIGKTKVFHANGDSIVNTYAINLFLPNQVAFSFIKVTLGKLEGTDLLIGMDVITQGDFSLTNVGGNTTFSFRVPSITEVDYVKDKKPVDPRSLYPGVGRNDPCPCGSGDKFKKCCGKP